MTRTETGLGLNKWVNVFKTLRQATTEESMMRATANLGFDWISTLFSLTDCIDPSISTG